jgi:superfamily II DNA or RNA helicase
MRLRPYQIELIEKVRNAYHNGAKAPCIVLPCGGGKSVIVADIAKSATEKKNRVLFLVHRKELVEQIKRTFHWWGVNMTKCEVMMVQTASRRISKLTPPQLIITDENHHSKASTYRKIYDAFPDAKRLGVTATPIRLDGSGLGDVNDELVIGVSAQWLIENHYLAPYDYYAPSIADLTGIKILHGEYETKSLEKAMLKTAVFGDAIKYYKQLADGKQAICYCVSVNHSMTMAEGFRLAGISAEHIDGGTPREERDRIISDFRKGNIKILCNVDLISEGFDVPDCECAILLRPTKSLTLYIQQSMRCMRYKAGKRAVIIDHVGNYARFGMPDADRKWSLENKKKSAEKHSVEVEVKALQCPECFYTFEPLGFGRTVCPACGYMFPKKERTLEKEEDTQLEKITGFVLNYASPDECRNMQELQDYAKKMGYKQGWCYYQGKKRGFI